MPIPHLPPATRRSAIHLGMLLAATGTLEAVELTDLAGDWALTRLDTPASLRETYYNPVTETTRTSVNSQDYAQAGETFVDAYYPDPLSVSSASFQFAANGSITGGETGTVLGISNNRMTYSDGIDVDTVYSNTPGDVLMAGSRDADQQNFALCLKRPASLTTSELAGTWNLISHINRDDLSRNYVDGAIVDTYFSGDATETVGAVTMDSSGNLSGLFSGTVNVTGPGTIDVTVTGEGTVPFVVNASKSVLVATLDHGSEQEYIILVKKPDTLSTAELAGSWRFCTVRVPTTLIETYYDTLNDTTRQADNSQYAQANEILVDVYHPDLFELNRLSIQVQPSGDFTGFGTGTVTANGDQSINVFIDGENHTFQCNADKTVMIGSVVDPDAHELIVGIRTGNVAMESIEAIVALGITPSTNGGPMVITWNSAENATLQGATTMGDWQDIPEAAGSDSFVVDPNEAGFKFFRVGFTP